MSKTILIADDDRVLVHMLQQGLEKEGYRVLAAFDGADALKKVQDEHPDLILLDIQMPKVHGYGFIFELRKIEGGESIPIVVLTSFSDMGEMFTAEGVKEYIVKPCATQVVVAKIKKHVPN